MKGHSLPLLPLPNRLTVHHRYRTRLHTISVTHCHIHTKEWSCDLVTYLPYTCTYCRCGHCNHSLFKRRTTYLRLNVHEPILKCKQSVGFKREEKYPKPCTVYLNLNVLQCVQCNSLYKMFIPEDWLALSSCVAEVITADGRTSCSAPLLLSLPPPPAGWTWCGPSAIWPPTQSASSSSDMER